MLKSAIMMPEQRKQYAKWLAKWRDADFLIEKARLAGLDITNFNDVLTSFEGPLKVAEMLSEPDPHSGVFDMQICFVRIAHEAKLRGVSLISSAHEADV